MTDTVARLTRAMSVVLFVIAFMLLAATTIVALHVNRVFFYEHLANTTRDPWIIFGSGLLAAIVLTAAGLGLASICLIYDRLDATTLALRAALPGVSVG